MDQTQLYRSIANATGETVEVVSRIGFSVLTPMVTEPDEASRWLRREKRRQWFKRAGQRRIHRHLARAAG